MLGFSLFYLDILRESHRRSSWLLSFATEVERKRPSHGFFNRVLRSTRDLRWLDWIFLGGYLPSLSINYVAMSKDMKKRLPQLCYIKIKISYDLGFIAIGVSMAT